MNPTANIGTKYIAPHLKFKDLHKLAAMWVFFLSQKIKSLIQAKKLQMVKIGMYHSFYLSDRLHGFGENYFGQLVIPLKILHKNHSQSVKYQSRSLHADVTHLSCSPIGRFIDSLPHLLSQNSGLLIAMKNLFTLTLKFCSSTF